MTSIRESQHLVVRASSPYEFLRDDGREARTTETRRTTLRIAMLHTRLRVEERLVLDAIEHRGLRAETIDLREPVFDLGDAGRWREFDLVIDRSLSLTSSLNAVRILESYGVRCVNPADSIELCADKLRTTLALETAGVPSPRTVVALSPEAALEACENVGYPCVIKPTVGSWGRLVSRVNDRHAAEAIIEHKDVLGSVSHQVFYVQEFIAKPDRDLRVFVVGGEPIAAIARTSEHWITNTARGGSAKGIDVTPEIADICRRAAACVGGDAVAIDLFECPRRGLLVNEINHSMEFRNSIDATGVDIPGAIVDHAICLVSSLASDVAATAGPSS